MKSEPCQTHGEILVDILPGLRIDRVRDFMRTNHVPTPRSNAALREQQHALIFAEPSAENGLKSSAGVEKRVHETDLGRLFNERQRQELPAALTLCEITFTDNLLEMVAVERRD